MSRTPLSFWERIRQNFLRRAPKYTTNFIKTDKGNGLKFGMDLTIRVRGAAVVTGRIYDAKNNKTYQIDQSHKNDKDKDAETTQFSLKTKLHPDAKAPGYNLPPGEYMIFTWWFSYKTMRGGTYRDKFVIV